MGFFTPGIPTFGNQLQPIHPKAGILREAELMGVVDNDFRDNAQLDGTNVFALDIGDNGFLDGSVSGNADPQVLNHPYGGLVGKINQVGLSAVYSNGALRLAQNQFTQQVLQFNMDRKVNRYQSLNQELDYRINFDQLAQTVNPASPQVSQLFDLERNRRMIFDQQNQILDFQDQLNAFAVQLPPGAPQLQEIQAQYQAAEQQLGQMEQARFQLHNTINNALGFGGAGVNRTVSFA